MFRSWWKKIQIRDECKKKQNLYYCQVSEEFRIAKAQLADSLKKRKKYQKIVIKIISTKLGNTKHITRAVFYTDL